MIIDKYKKQYQKKNGEDITNGNKENKNMLRYRNRKSEENR